VRDPSGSPASLAAWAIFVDYDGTITDRDTFDVLVEAFAGPHVWAQTERELDEGGASIRDVLQRQAGYVTGDYDNVRSILRREIAVDATFAQFAREVVACGAALTVVSSGIEPIIRERLDDAGARDVAIVANGLEPDPSGWKIVYRDGSPNGTDKSALVRAARARGRRTAFVGDGRSDFAAAELADVRFAKRGRLLEGYLRERGLAYAPFSSFAEIGALLDAARRDCA
jgi:HAD superfamily phosphoserine phosphatase-like hydrolase